MGLYHPIDHWIGRLVVKADAALQACAATGVVAPIAIFSTIRLLFSNCLALGTGLRTQEAIPGGLGSW